MEYKDIISGRNIIWKMESTNVLQYYLNILHRIKADALSPVDRAIISIIDAGVFYFQYRKKLCAIFYMPAIDAVHNNDIENCTLNISLSCGRIIKQIRVKVSDLLDMSAMGDLSREMGEEMFEEFKKLL